MQSKNIFLTIEGIEGVGKSTAVKFIEEYLTKAHKNFIITREPGGTPIAEEVRHVLLTPQSAEVMVPETELLLMFACRIQHIHHVIIPALKAGQWVISDRFIDASFAYQGGGRGIATSHIEMLENWLVKDLQPDTTILLDAPPEVGLLRAKHRGSQDRIEQEKIDFFDRVREGYLNRARRDARRFRIIDATQSLETVLAEIKKVLDEKF
jgi:dTMP kinase